MILHIDLNSFYASCAVIKSNGAYTFDTPLMVCGDPKKRHGVVLAATYPVKKKGVRAGMPVWEALARCPEAVLSAPDYSTYTDYSERFMAIISDYSPLIMRFGIDEAYLDYAGCEHLFGPPVSAANTIRERVKRELGLSVSVGVGENPLMAKMGSDYKKPDAVTVIDGESWKRLIWPLGVQNLMYVGRSAAERLEGAGIRRIGELAAARPDMIERLFGKSGKMMWLHANGVDDTRIEAVTERQKCISNSSTMAQDVSDREQLASALVTHTEKVAYRLRGCGMLAGVAGIQLRYNDLSFVNRQATLAFPTNITKELVKAVISLLDSLPLKLPVRQAGVRLAGLTAEGEQLSLIDAAGREKLHSLDFAADSLRRRYGENILRLGSMPPQKDEFDESVQLP